MTADRETPRRDLPEIPDLELLRLVGQGGFGEVWLARNRTTGHLRAVKLVPLETADHRDRAGREVSSLARLEAIAAEKHPHLMEIHHVGKTAQHLFYIMDPADDISGKLADDSPDYTPATLRRRIANGPLPADACRRFAEQLLSALHEAGLVHRDVKPANCLFVRDRLKLADFGLLTEDDPLVSQVGTRTYMPPDGRMDTRADVYAAGLILYEMLTSQSPRDFPRLADACTRIAADPGLQRLNQLALRACQPDPQKRFADASRMLAELLRPAARGSRLLTRRKMVWGILAAVATIGVAATFLSRWPSGTSTLGTSPSAPIPTVVDVNFITEPFEAEIHLDGKRLERSPNEPMRTPCTAIGLPSQSHHVVFEHPQHGRLDAGWHDFAITREIEARFPR